MSAPKTQNVEPAKASRTLIYIVDDEAMLLELATVILEPLGYQVECYRDPDLALKQFRAAHPRPALIITDYAMHSMNGMDLIAACRKVEPSQKVLMLSGTVGPEVSFTAPDQPNQFLAKPYHARELTDMVASMLKS